MKQSIGVQDCNKPWELWYYFHIYVLEIQLAEDRWVQKTRHSGDKTGDWQNAFTL